MKKVSNVPQSKNLLGLYLKEISAYPLLTLEEELRLGRLAQQGDEHATQRLVEANLRFVVKVARRYHGIRLSLLDLIHEGNLGLIEAAKRFDPSRGFRFLTYAVWWIRQSILSAISTHSHPFRIPLKVSANLYRINAVLATQNDSGPKPSMEELAAQSGLPYADIEMAMRSKHETVSLHQPLFSDGDQSLEEVLPDPAQSGFALELMNRELRQNLKTVVDQLTSREQRVLALRFGLDGDEPQTLGEVGRRIGVCRERVRQIQVAAMHKLRNNDAARTIAGAFA